MTDRMWRGQFFFLLFVSAQHISNKELSADLPGWTPTGCMIELTASPRSSCSLISQHGVSSTGHQGHRWLGGQRPSLLSELCQKHNSLASALQLITHFTPHYWQYWVSAGRMGKSLPSLAASAMIISAKCPACAGEREARNVIKFYSRIIFIQIRVQSLMLALHCPGAAIRQTYFHSNDQKHSYLLILIWQFLTVKAWKCR